MPKHKIPKKELEQELIADKVSYFNIIVSSIQNINNSIMQDNDARDAADNLLSDLPDDWSAEIEGQVQDALQKYDYVTQLQAPKLTRGTPLSIQNQARREIFIAQKNYSRAIKKIVISLMKEKKLLYNAREPLETGYLSLYDNEDMQSDD